MKNNLNVMVLNNENIGISKIELNKSDLLITDKSGKYCLQVYVRYNWKEINSLIVGTPQYIDFNEYCFSENNEAALILPSNCFVEKINNHSLYFDLEFDDLANTTHFMNRRGCFDIELNSLEVKVLVDYNDAIEDSIIYKFN